MERYFESFSLVELNSTFYHYPRERTVEGWSEKAPKEFEFTVKAHQDISHKARLKAEEVSFQAFEHMKQICKALDSKISLIQTPNSLKPDKLADAEEFLRKVDREGLVLVWETRGTAWEANDAYEKLRRTLEELDVTHVTDPFRIMPAYSGRIAYFRLHGLGERMYYYQYSDSELQRLKELVAPYESEGKEVYILFNNLTMFDDALRFKEYLSKGTFRKLTSSTGLASMTEVASKTHYPNSKAMLIRRLGWRLVQIEEAKQIRFGTFLNELPSKNYKSAEELLNDLKSARKMKD